MPLIRPSGERFEYGEALTASLGYISATWTRVEPQPVEDDLRSSLEAGIADPLWLLARQWQFGEFEADDAGSLAAARVRGQAGKLSSYLPRRPEHGAAGEAYDPSALPLEAVVERESRRPGRLTSREAAEAGLRLLRMLEAANESGDLAGDYRGLYVTAYPLEAPAEAEGPMDAARGRFFRVLAGRVPDGAKLYSAIREAGRIAPDSPEITEPDRDALVAIVEEWSAWFEGRFGLPAEGDDQATARSWIDERLEYEFAVSAATSGGDETVLVAPEYPGGQRSRGGDRRGGDRGDHEVVGAQTYGQLDWYSFDLARSGALGAGGGDAPSSESRTVVPTPVEYRGMPSSRLWQFEDREVNFAAVESAPTDIGRLLLLEYALVSGGDQFLIPVDLDVGSVWEIDSLVVEDSFGIKTLVRSASATDAASDWSMFDLAPDGDANEGEESRDVFLLAPTLVGALEGEPVEEVLFMRDEMANLAWALENTVEGPTGEPIRRRELYLERLRREEIEGPTESQPVGDGPPLVYRIATGVPDYWIPLVPVEVGSGPEIRLVEGSVVGAGGSALGKSLGQILKRGDGPDEPFWLYEEEVPRSGTRVTRTYQLARWFDGSHCLWIGRSKGSGRGEGSSGLRFDVVTDRRTPP